MPDFPQCSTKLKSWLQRLQHYLNYLEHFQVHVLLLYVVSVWKFSHKLLWIVEVKSTLFWPHGALYETLNSIFMPKFRNTPRSYGLVHGILHGINRSNTPAALNITFSLVQKLFFLILCLIFLYTFYPAYSYNPKNKPKTLKTKVDYLKTIDILIIGWKFIILILLIKLS